MELKCKVMVYRPQISNTIVRHQIYLMTRVQNSQQVCTMLQLVVINFGYFLNS